MNGTKKNFAGPAIVLGIIVLATLGAGMTWRNYIADHPGAVRAELRDEKTVSAEFSPEKARLIPEGSKAIISVNGVRSTGYVTGMSVSGGATHFRIRLLQPIAEVSPGTPCQVTVDLTLPPEAAGDSSASP